MTNADVFKKIFSEIEDYLRRYTRSDRYVTFSDLVDKAAVKNKIVDIFMYDLKSYGNLRNSLVHTNSNKFMADPYDETIKSIQSILDQLVNPPKLDKFKQSDLLLCNTSDNINNVLTKMLDRNFSQVPVIENKIIKGLLTTDTISRWVAFELKTNEILGNDETVEKVLLHTEIPENYKIMGREKLLVDVLDLFEKAFETGKPISAVLVTEAGKSNETILGIVTPYDIPRMEKLVRVI